MGVVSCYYRNSVHILGVDNNNVPRILGIIGDVISCDVLSDDNMVLQRLMAIVRHVQVRECMYCYIGNYRG